MKRFGQHLLAALHRLVVGPVPPAAPAPRGWQGGRVISPPQPHGRDPYDTLKPGDLRPR
jgi:hypothetical protein